MPAQLFDAAFVGGNPQDALNFIVNILQASTDYSLIGKGRDGTILLWNEGARRLYGYKIGTPRNPEVCAVISAHSPTVGSYHVGRLKLDWRAGLFVGSVHDQTDLVLTFT